MNPHGQQAGAVLVIALALLAIIQLAGITALSVTIAEKRLAANEQARIEAQTDAQSLIAAAASWAENFDRSQVLDQTRCNMASAQCPGPALRLPGSMARLAVDLNSGRAGVSVTRLDSNVPPTADLGWSLVRYSTSRYQIEARVDRSQAGLARAHVLQNLILVHEPIQNSGAGK